MGTRKGKYPGGGFPTVGHPPRKGLMGGECPDEAQGCRVMGKNKVSHDRNTPGTRISQGCHPVNLRGPVPKRDGPSQRSGRVKPHREHREPSERVFPFPLKNFALGLEIRNNNFTTVVRTTDRKNNGTQSQGRKRGKQGY